MSELKEFWELGEFEEIIGVGEAGCGGELEKVGRVGIVERVGNC